MSTKKATIEDDLKNRVKKAFLKGFKSKDIQHPLFDASKTEAKRLMITRRGLQELKDYDYSLHRLLKKWVTKNKIKSSELKSKIDKWIVELKRRTGDERKSYRQPLKIVHTKSKSGYVNRPLDLIYMDLADVNRLNPDNHRYRYPFILVAVDAFTNYVVLIPIKNKTGDEIINTMKNAFSQFGLNKKKCSSKNANSNFGGTCFFTTNIQTDRGSEFFNYKVKQFLTSRNFKLFATRGSGKAYLAESKIGQMKRQLMRITKILESSVDKRQKRRKKKNKDSLVHIGKKKKNNKRNKEKEEEEEEEDFVDFKIYATDWSRHLKDLQMKINKKPRALIFALQSMRKRTKRPAIGFA